jgi:hypothetical protein
VGVTFGGGTTDVDGRATVRLPLDAGVRRGAAVLAAEVWSEATPGLGCVPEVHEHGYVETALDVR